MTLPTKTELTQLEPGVVATPFRNVANPNQNASGSRLAVLSNHCRSNATAARDGSNAISSVTSRGPP